MRDQQLAVRSVYGTVGGGQCVRGIVERSVENGVIEPSSWYTMVAVRFDEKASTRALTSSTASQLATA